MTDKKDIVKEPRKNSNRRKLDPKNIFAKLFSASLGSELALNEASWLIFSKNHWELLSQRRAKLIARRSALITPILGICTLLWIMVDLKVFDIQTFTLLSGFRLIAAIIFFFCSYCAYKLAKSVDINLSKAKKLIILPTLCCAVFHIISQFILSKNHAENNMYWDLVVRGYAFLPIVMASSVALFPFTVAESFMGSLIALIALLVGVSFNSLDTFAISDIWLCLLICAVAIFSGASQLSFLIEMSKAAFKDALTGVYGRLSAIELLDLHEILARKTNIPLSIVFFDLDHFKSVNDNYGHEQGDNVLKLAANGILNGFRKSDIIARWGGEEFVAILPNATKEQAIIALNRFLKADESNQTTGLGLRPDGKNLTASIGVSELFEDNCKDWKELVELADKRMYVAKTTGRDRIISS